MYHPKVLDWTVPSEHTGPGRVTVPISQMEKLIIHSHWEEYSESSCLCSGEYLPAD